MAESNRGKGTAPVDWFFPIIGLLIALGIAWGVGVLQGSENVRRSAAPHYHGESAKERALSRCAGRQAASLVECVQEQIQAAEDTARTEQDLTAQQEAAWAAILSSIWAAFGLVVTVIGTTLLYQQIKLTREALEYTGAATEAMRAANEIASEVAYANLRPFIIAKDVRVSNFRLGECPVFAFAAVNMGNSVARDVRIKARVLCRDEMRHEKIWIPMAFGFRANVAPRAEIPADYKWVFPLGDLHRPDLTRPIWYAGIITYRDQAGKTRRTTFSRYVDLARLDKAGNGLLSYAPKGNRSN